MKIEDFKRLGEVLIDHDYSNATPDNPYGNNPSSAMASWLTLTNYIQPAVGQAPYFLFATNFFIDSFVNNVHRLQPIYYTGLDYLIDHFINYRIGHSDPIIFRNWFARRFNQVEANYTLAYNAWNSYYELGVNPTTINAPLFSDYYREHKEEFNANIIRNSDGTLTNTTDGTSKTTAIGNTTGVADTISSGDNAGTSKLVTTTEGDTSSTTNMTGKTTNDLTTNTSNETANTGENRTLVSDMPQSIVNASTTGNPADITWKYATNLQDNILNTKNTTTDETTNTGTVDTTNETTSSGTNNSTVTGTGDSTETLSGTSKTTTTGDSTVTNTGENNAVMDVKSTTQDNTSDTHAVNSIDVGYGNLQTTVNAFLASPFAKYFWNNLFAEFEDLFLSSFDLERYPLYEWKIDRDGVGVIIEESGVV